MARGELYLPLPFKESIISLSGDQMNALAYPATRYEPSPLVDLTAAAESERLSPSALKAFFNIADRWKLRDEDAKQLLGGVSNGPGGRC